MQRETRRRIAYYQKALPNMKERVAAAAVMLLIAVIVTVTTTYAWVTLSVAPVVSSVNTTVASNGTLEIALAPNDGSLPREYDVDESVANTTKVTVSNLQWGNLINLSDPAYGIDNLVLRPAQLNTESLKNSPLWGAVYGADGRISTLDSNYTYTKWDGNQFVSTDGYGVRSIASYKVEISESTSATQRTLAEAANAAHNSTNIAYYKVHGLVQSMSSMLSTYVQGEVPESLGGGNVAPFTSAQLDNAYKLLETLIGAMEAHKEALVALAKYQAYVADSAEHNYTAVDWNYLVANKAAFDAPNSSTLSSDGVISLVGLTSFINDLNRAKEDIVYLQKYCEEVAAGKRSVYWSTGGDSGHQISDIVSMLLAYNELTIEINGQEVAVSTLASDPVGYATDLVGMNGDHTPAVIRNGLMLRFEQSAIDEAYRLKGPSSVGGAAVVTVKVSVKLGVSMTITLYGDCYTAASGSSYYMGDYMAAMGQNIVPSDAVAEDTYGMAVDFWLRTNAEDTFLTLEGAVATDADGKVLSYDGVNRVWGSTGNVSLTTNSTTQGSGSCYIYYADTPEDMARSLGLLDNMKVAFVDGDGNLMALAKMDTGKHYAVNGRIIVPLVVEENSGVDYTYKDESNAEQTGRAIAAMTHDEPKWVTAIIYLDGAGLSNENVLAAADIDGQLNIQFGSSADLNTRGDNKLLVDERTVIADVNPKELDFTTAVEDSDLTAQVTVRVEGTKATTMSAFFLRAVNETQGERQKTMTFTEQADGTWTANHVFEAPGTYYLRYVRVNGVDYALTDPQVVEVKGFSVKNISWGEPSKEAVVYSPETYYTEPVSVSFASTDTNKMPKTVQARFQREDGNIVNVDMTYDSSSARWSGEGTFYTSGNYTLQYLLLDGEYYDISSHEYKLTLYLGLGVTVYNNGSSTNDMFDGEAEPGVYHKNVGVKIADNAGNELKAMEGAVLKYSMGGSASNTVDTNLVWNEANEWYTGTLPITRAGRYSFLQVNIAGSSLNRVTEAPVYVIVSPDPPIYQTSVSHYNSEVQFAPLTNDAYIGPIAIDDSASASLSAVVYNNITDKEYTVTMSDVQNAPGTMYYEGGYWYINLPTYTLNVDENGDPLAGAVYTQEGQWSVKQISAWDCYDADSKLRNEEDPIVWTDTNSDFSKLSTVVSCSINVTMAPGTTELGGDDAAFMTKHAVKDLGMMVTIVDNDNRPIPAAKIKDINLKVAYTAPVDTSYGYEVASGANREYNIKLNSAGTDGQWYVSENAIWQYVGSYTVQNLTITMSNGSTLTYDPGKHGVAEKYTVRSMAPTIENLNISTPIQGQTVFGKTGNNVTGYFLESYGGTSLAALDIALTPKADDNTSHARISDLTATVSLNYKDGSNAPNGGYSWSSYNPLSYITLGLTNNNTSTNRYVAGETSLLAGTYKLSAVVTMGDESVTVSGWKDIEVYSLAPDVTMTAVSDPVEGTKSFTVNSNAGNASTGHLTANAVTFAANNAIVNDGKSALVFASYRPFTADNNTAVYIGDTIGRYERTTYSAAYTDYEMPSITFALSNAGTICNNFTLTIPNSNGNAAQFTGNGSVAANIGWVEAGTENHPEDCYVDVLGSDVNVGERDFYYKWEKAHVIGTQTINTITAVVDHKENEISNVVNYTLDLAAPLSIVQENEAAPSISIPAFIYTAGNASTGTTELTFTERAGAVSEDGLEFTFTLPTQAQYDKLKANLADEDSAKDNIIYEEGSDSEGWVQQGETYTKTQYVKYANRTSIISGYPTAATEIKDGLGYKDYQATSRCNFYFDVWKHQITNYKRTGKVTSHEVTYGLNGWKVEGRTYAPGATITVTDANTVATPVIAELSRDKISSDAVKVQTKVVETLEKQTNQIVVGGNEATGQATGRNYGLWNTYSQAQKDAQTNANTNAANRSCCPKQDGEISSESELPVIKDPMPSEWKNP